MARSHRQRDNEQLLTGAGLALLLVITGLIYLPGLSGGFLFDDWSNLSLLGAYGRIDNWESFQLYMLSGFSGPTGRPLAALSFLIDANNWPADPEPFKRTNVLIHLATGIALFGLVRQLTMALGHSSLMASRVALLTAALWLLHPFWVSTTLYTVQRMAQLSTLFVLLGLWLYAQTRLMYPPTLNRSIAIGTTTAIGLFGLLAVFSKENGALLPLLAMTLEATVLAAHDREQPLKPTRGFRVWRLALLGLPTLLLAIFVLGRGLPPLLQGEAGLRDFTPWERLLTQGRILWDYLFNLALPRPFPGGLFNDDIVISTGLFQPWTTALAWGAWLVLLAWSWRTRLHRPALALAILFFLAGHVLESSFLQLELYFEHRNYLPAALLGFPFALCWVRLPWRDGLGKGIVTAAVLATLALTTTLRADLWGKPFQQSLKWAQTNPESPRALHNLADRWQETGNLPEAERLNARAVTLDPDGLPWLIQAVVLDCRQGRDATTTIARVEEALATARGSGAVIRHQLSTLLDYLLADNCGSTVHPDTVLSMIERLAKADRQHPIPGLQPLLEQRAGVALLMMGVPDKAYERLSNGVSLSSSPGQQLLNAAILASHGAYKQALALLDQPQPPEAGHTSIGGLRQQYQRRSAYFERERASLRARIKENMAAEEAPPPSLVGPAP